MAARTKAWTLFDHSDTVDLILYPFPGMMSVRVFSVFVLSCVELAAVRRADPPSKESYQQD
jgi:hypothetical protein